MARYSILHENEGITRNDTLAGVYEWSIYSIWRKVELSK